MSSHTAAITAVRWGGEGHIFSASRDCSINVWDGKDGRLIHRCVRACVCECLEGEKAWGVV